MLTQKRLKEVLNYNPETGIFTWIKGRHCVKAGDVAGCEGSNSEILIRVDGVLYLAHRLAWLWEHGVFPPKGLDHKDRNRSNNAISNLRPANQSQNAANRKVQQSGLKGTQLSKQGWWVAKITNNYKAIYLGRYPTQEQAHAVYMEAASRLFGEFARAA